MSAGSLVVQAPAATHDTLRRLATAAGARAIVPIGFGSPVAYRLLDAHDDPALVDAARAARCDAALVPEARRLDRVRVVAMDMDSTLITIECIDEIADMKGIKPEVAAITRSAMRGEIDFAESLTRRVALLAGLPAADLARVYDERLRISPGAARMLAAFRAAGAATALLSGGFTFFTDRLQARLGFDVAIANVFEMRGDRLTGRITGAIVDANGKAAALRELAAKHRGHDGLVVAIGDGANDLPMFAAADVSIAYRAKPIVRAAATCALDFCDLSGAVNWFA
ncbi:MAG: phosphoserine phosphatase SerB [Burkholderiales bacterium]|nr:phosphoserine phosphatase SerB [Burkholderiales bacterium]